MRSFVPARLTFFLILPASCWLALNCWAVEKNGENKKDKKAAASEGTAFSGKVHRVVRGPFKVETTLAGVVESSSMTEVSVAPQLWTELEVAEIVPAGSHVTRGQPLLRFDTVKLDDTIRELQAGQELADLKVKQTEAELKHLRESAPVAAERLERAKQQADEDLQWYQQVAGSFAKKSAQYELKYAEQWLEYATEELKQLEKMYAADDLTEETEEIILKRARNDVERARFYYERSKVEHDQTLKIDLPRAAQSYEDRVRQAALALEESRALLPLKLRRQELDLEELRFEREKSARELKRYERDHELLTVTAPADGIIYYGRCVRGKWNWDESEPQLRPGGKVEKNQVLLTIVRQDQLFVRAVVPEQELGRVQTGAAAKITLPGFPDVRMPVKVRSLSDIPVAAGNFDARLDFLAATPVRIVSGMSCVIKLTAYLNPQAITVPTESVFHDPLDDEKHFVYVVGADEKPIRRDVSVGLESVKVREITAGLAVGDRVLLEKPSE